MPRRLIAPFVAALVMLFAAAAPSSARNNPLKAPVSTGGADASGEMGFSCGTYRGNWDEGRAQYHRYRTMKKEFALGRSAPLPSTEFVYDNVWVVEDDGTILLSGTNAFDTQTSAFRFTPNAGGYDASQVAYSFDAAPGVDLGLGDDTASQQSLPFAFDFYGQSWTDVWVGANGVIGFGANPDPAGFYDNNDFWNTTPKIAAYFADLDPSSASSGSVYFRSAVDSVVITWNSIVEFGTVNPNTFQVVLRSDDTFDVRFATISTTTASNGAPIVTGVNPGGAAPQMERISFSADLPHAGLSGAGVYEDYYSLTNPQVNEVALMHRFYESFPDSFFQTIFFTDFPQTMAGFANEVNIENGVTGIGLPIFDNSALYGSNGILESRCNMNQLAAWPYTNPYTRMTNRKGNSFLTIMGQESGHRWGAFAMFRDDQGQISNMILGRSDAHWSYYVDVNHSSLEGGNWTETSPGFYNCPTSIDYFDRYDEYMMGLRTPEEVRPTYYISSPFNDQAVNRSVGTPVFGASASGTPVEITIEDIISAEGPRTPLASEEERDLRQAFILIIQNGGTATQAELDKIAGFRRAWESYFEKACDGRITVNTRLHQQWPIAVMRGRVTNRLTDEPVEMLVIESVERGFVQVVPGGGNYEFRYQADENSSIGWPATVEVSAAGYYPETIQVSIPYGVTFEHDIELDPVPSNIEGDPRPLPSALYQNLPNPFNPTTTIPYDVSARSRVSLVVYDVAGHRVRTLVDDEQSPGHKRVAWDGRDDNGRAVASGVYVYRVQIGAFSSSRKMILIK